MKKPPQKNMASLIFVSLAVNLSLTGLKDPFVEPDVIKWVFSYLGMKNEAMSRSPARRMGLITDECEEDYIRQFNTA